MNYLLGIHALNLKCSLDTCGDWHTSALHWDHLPWRKSNGSLFAVFVEPRIPWLQTRGVSIYVLAEGNEEGCYDFNH